MEIIFWQLLRWVAEDVKAELKRAESQILPQSTFGTYICQSATIRLDSGELSLRGQAAKRLADRSP
jgi:hypothetical protein